MTVPWTKVIGGVVSLAGIIGGGAFGKKLIDRIGSIENTVVAVTETVVRQADRAVEALPWERQLRMMDALITDCDAVSSSERTACVAAREKLKGQLQTMSRAMGLPQTATGDWEISAWIEHRSQQPFRMPVAAIVDVQLPNLTTVDESSLEAAVAAELGRAMSAAASTPPALEARRPLTDTESETVIRNAASEILHALLVPDLERSRGVQVSAQYSSLMPLRASEAAQECVRSRRPSMRGSGGFGPSPDYVRAQTECAYQVTEAVFQSAFFRAVSAYHTTVPYSALKSTDQPPGSVYRLVRPYNPYGPQAHTILVMDLAELTALGPLGDSLRITMAVHRAGHPDSLYPGAQRQHFAAASLIRSPSTKWALDKRGIAWIGHGLIPREAAPVTPTELRQIRETALELAEEVYRKYGRPRQVATR